MFTALVLSFLQLASSPGVDLTQDSQNQAETYISNIEDGKNVDENLWALTLLTTEHPKVHHFVEENVQNGNYTSQSIALFENIAEEYTTQLEKLVFHAGSPDLLIELLLKTESKQEREKIYQRFQSEHNLRSEEVNYKYKLLCNAILNEEPIGSGELNTSFQLAHFFLLFENIDLLPKDFIEEVIANWSKDNPKSNNLKNSLSAASYLKILYNQYKYSETANVYQYLISDKVFPNSSLKLKIYRYLDYSMYRLGYYDRSLEIVRQFTLPLSEFLGKHNQKIAINLSKGVYLYSIGKIKSAQKIYQNLLDQVDKNDPEIKLSSLYNNLALTYYQLGKFDKYLDLQLQALERAEQSENHTHQLNVYKNLFIYYRQNNDSESALRYIEKAQKLAKETNKTAELGKIYTLRGSLYINFEKDYSLAHKYFLKAEQILDPDNNVKYYTDLLRDQARAFEEQRQYDKALQKYDQMINVSPKGNNPNHLYALVNKASVYLKTNHINRSKKLIDQFKSLNLDQLSFQQVIKAKEVEADYLQRTDKSQQALDILEPALDQIVVRAKGSADLKSGFWHVEDEYLEAFELAVSIYNKTGQPGKAVEVLDKLKTINDASLYQNPLVKSSLLNESELTQYKKLTNQLDATRKKLLTAPENKRFDIRQTISRLKLKKRKLDRKLTSRADTDHISIREVQNNLSARELVIHITELNDQFYIAQISRSDVTINRIPLDSARRNLLSHSVEQVATNKTNLESLYKISQFLEINKIPDRIEKVTLIPDSYFYQLPIDILPLEKPTHSYSYGQVTYVIEKFRTQYLTSLDDFKTGTGPKPASISNYGFAGYGVSNFSGYGNKSLVPLPHAKTEITNIAGRLTHLSGVRTYIDEQSTKSMFSQTAPNSRIIHLATHSEVSERDPMFSSIYLSKDNSSSDSTLENQLFAYEMFELNLNNEMIMLNSCESGSGSYIQGTGVMGISRALQYAGAQSLILNLWSVNDKLASDFAIHFYDQLNKGKSKAEALRDAKRHFLENKNASPHFWGPYMLIGNTDPIIEPNRNMNLAMAGAFIFYFLLMVGLSYLTQRGFLFGNRQEYAA